MVTRSGGGRYHVMSRSPVTPPSQWHRPPQGAVGLIAASAAGVVVLAVVTTWELGTVEGRRTALNTAFVVGAVAVLGSALAKLLRSPARHVRDLLVLGAGTAWTFGNGWWFYYHEVSGQPAYPGWSDVGYLTALPFAAVLVLRVLPRLSGPAGRRLLVDAVLVGLGIFTVLWVLYIEQALEHSDRLPALVITVSLAYPLVDAALATLAITALRHARTVESGLLAAALLSYFGADLAWNYTALHGGYTASSEPSDALRLLAYLLLAALPWSPVAARPERAAPPRSPLVAVFPVAGAFTGLLLLLTRDYDGLETEDLMLFAAVGAVTVARQLLLTRDLLAANRGLHEEVDRQTAELRESHDRLRELAFQDSLTGLANRRYLARVFDQLASSTEVGQHALALLDLDDFKNVNDGLGHEIGDLLLTRVAARLTAAARDGDVVVRLGGDEFAVLLRDVQPEHVPGVATRLLEALQQPLSIGTADRLMPRASMGVAHCSGTDSASDVLRRADVAMYAAKRAGKGRFTIYDPQVHTAVVDLHMLESALFVAPLNDELRLHFQPLVDLASGRVVGCEALVRWEHPERGLVSPAEFIPAAERIGAIDCIGLWVLEEAASRLVEWQRRVPGLDLTVSVNVSPLQLQSGVLCRDIDEILARTGLAPERLVVEITESALARREDAATVLTELRERGITVALDDFGAGMSSLGQLRQLPVDVLKIDRSFVSGLDVDERGRAYLRTIVELGHTLGMRVCAEGVETERQANLVGRLGCHTAQGWHFGRPVAADEFAARYVTVRV